MAELAAVGIVATIIQLVHFSTRVVRQIDQYRSDFGEIPKFLRHIHLELPVLSATLENLQAAVESESFGAGAQDALVAVINGCREQVEQLDTLIVKALPTSGDSLVEKGKNKWKAVKSLRFDDQVNNITKILRGYIGTLTFYCTAVSSNLQPKDDTKLQEMRGGLNAPDPSSNYQKALKQREKGTGLWLLESDAYANWKQDAASFLWLHGIPGCGKKILSSTIFENVIQHCTDDPGKVVSYFYFDFNEKQKQTPDLMIRSMICQLSQQCVKLPTNLETLFSSCGKVQQQPATPALLEVMKSVIEEFPHVYTVIDALDECAERSELTNALESIAAWKLQNLHVLVMSRRERDLEVSLTSLIQQDNVVCIQSKLLEKDIQRYVQKRLSTEKDLKKWHKDATIRQEIEDALMKGAHGMFRWAACQLDILGKCRNRAMLRNRLSTLPPTLDKTYKRILCAISEDDSKYALRILRWLAFSAQPLSMGQIAEIVALDADEDPAFNSEEVLEESSEVFRICSSLITTTISLIVYGNGRGKEECIVLAHYSVKYLVSTRIRDGPAAKYSMREAECHDNISKCCIEYLLRFQETEVENPYEESRFEELSKYSAIFWPYHALQTRERSDEYIQSATKLFSEKKMYTKIVSDCVT